jgi:SAM-dependent methyltransferase
MSSNVWETFFDNHAPKYDDEVFTKGTEAEIAFLADDLQIGDLAASPDSTHGAVVSGAVASPPAGTDSVRLLDLGCGTGRHSVELARRGFAVTGVDLSQGMLDQAAARARDAHVDIDLIHADATTYDGGGGFHVALCICEGSMGLMGVGEDPHEHDGAVLATLFRALRPGGLAVINALNAFKAIREATDADVAAGHFDPLTTSQINVMPYEGPNGPGAITGKEKSYLPAEFMSLVEASGFEVEQLWGGTAGRWARRPLELDEYEMMVVARKPR